MNTAPPSATDKIASVTARTNSHLQRGELAEARSLLTDALARSPDDAAFLHLMGNLLRLENSPAEAEELYRRSLASLADQPHVHRDLGKLLGSLGRMDEAAGEFREAIRLEPNDSDAHLGLAAANARQGRFEAAETDYRATLRLRPGHFVARLGLAEMQCNLGRPAEAERVLREAPAASEPALAAAFALRLAVALKQQKKYPQALAQFDAALSHRSDWAVVDFLRAETLQQMGRWKEAALFFRKVLAHDPDHADAAGSLALISALTGDFAGARQWAAKTLARKPAHASARVAFALADIEDGDFASAAERLNGILENPAVPKAEGTAVLTGIAADAFDRHGRYHEAFAVSRASKAMLRDVWPTHTGAPRMIDVVQEMTNYFDKSEPWIAGGTPKIEARPLRHVFVLGFLRSGTTLIETILASGQNVVHAHEVDFLADAAHAFLGDKTNLDRLATLTDADIAAWQNKYWNGFRDAHYSVAGNVFIDKMPINTLRLPLIARLFPGARIVFAIRDPRDVVLSCFRHHFDRTTYSMEFLQLENCARFYAAAMAFADICRKKLPLDILDLRYEDIVADFDSTVGTLCRFSGVDWSETMRDFRQAAGEIDLRSASALQVRRGLYSGAVGHWRNYRAELAPVLPILAPWIAKFGYPVE